MNQLARNKQILQKYIPARAVDLIAEWVYTFDFKLKVKKARSSKYGDYRQPYKGLNHQITINNNLNQYAFLITLVHELAHLTTYNKFKNSVKPHGPEWKNEYKRLMLPFMSSEIFPNDILQVLQKSMQNPGASGCSDLQLHKILKRYDSRINNMVHVEDIPFGARFIMEGGKVFKRGKKLRTRYECHALKSGEIYLFNALFEVYLDKTEEFHSV